MRPRTKLQVQVKSLSDQLPKLISTQNMWAYTNCLNHVGYRTKTKISCLDCGHQWVGKQKVKTCICPECGIKLSIQDTLKKNLKQDAIVVLMDVVDGFQVNRFFEIKASRKARWKPELSIREIVQQWFEPNGKLTIVARMMSYYNGGYNGAMEIRTNLSCYYKSNKYDLYADNIFPESEFLPIYKRNGFTVDIKGVVLYSMLNILLWDSKLETLLKAKQYGLASARLGRRDNDIYKYWDSIKICTRNKYIVKDAISYLDYLEMLGVLGKDLRSPKYVCPINFNAEHNRVVALINRKKEEEKKLTAIQAQINYVKNKSPYFGIVISDGELTIKFIESVNEFLEEGKELIHCVYTSNYYNKLDSLCFSARIDGKRTETVEISLSTLKIIQSRGRENKPSVYHNQILGLMKKNMNVIKSRYKSIKKEAV